MTVSKKIKEEMKMETKIVKDGFTYGKQIYVLIKNGERVKYSIHKDRLEEFERMLQRGEEIPTKDHHETYKDYARVVKCGFWNGNQRYALRYDGKNQEHSIHKDVLEKKAKEINEAR